MALADDLQLDVAAVLDDDDFGRNVTLQQATPGAYDPATGVTAAGTTRNVNTRGMLLSFRDRQINGTTILQGDRKCILKVVTGVTPEVGNKLVIGSETFTLVNDVRRVALGSDGTVIVFILQLRK